METTFGQDLISSMAEAVAIAQGKCRPACVHRGTSLDSFLESEGALLEFQERAIEEVVVWQHEGEASDPQD